MSEAPDSDRDIEMLAELAELGLELAREVADLAKRRIVEARQSGWDYGLPADPGAPFAKLAQSVRRSIALKTKLARDATAPSGPAGAENGGLFASSGPPLNLAPDFAAAVAPAPLGADRLLAEAGRERDGRETIASDLGPLIDPRERLFEIPIGPVEGHAAAICESLGLDPARVGRRLDGWFVRLDPAACEAAANAPLIAAAGEADEIRLRDWRPDPAAILKAEGWPAAPRPSRLAKRE